MYRNRRILEERREEFEKEKIIRRKFFGINDDTSIITSILHPRRIDNNGLPEVWCLDFKMKGKSKKITRERRDLILNFCAEIEQHFQGADRKIFLPKINSLLTTYDVYAAKLDHIKNLSDAFRQLLIEDFANYSSPNIEYILKNLKSREPNELVDGYMKPITMIFTSDGLREMNRQLNLLNREPEIGEFDGFDTKSLFDL